MFFHNKIIFSNKNTKFSLSLRKNFSSKVIYKRPEKLKSYQLNPLLFYFLKFNTSKIILKKPNYFKYFKYIFFFCFHNLFKIFKYNFSEAFTLSIFFKSSSNILLPKLSYIQDEFFFNLDFCQIKLTKINSYYQSLVLGKFLFWQNKNRIFFLNRNFLFNLKYNFHSLEKNVYFLRSRLFLTEAFNYSFRFYDLVLKKKNYNNNKLKINKITKEEVSETIKSSLISYNKKFFDKNNDSFITGLNEDHFLKNKYKFDVDNNKKNFTKNIEWLTITANLRFKSKNRLLLSLSNKFQNLLTFFKSPFLYSSGKSNFLNLNKFFSMKSFLIKYKRVKWPSILKKLQLKKELDVSILGIFHLKRKSPHPFYKNLLNIRNFYGYKKNLIWLLTSYLNFNICIISALFHRTFLTLTTARGYVILRKSQGQLLRDKKQNQKKDPTLTHKIAEHFTHLCRCLKYLQLIFCIKNGFNNRNLLTLFELMLHKLPREITKGIIITRQLPHSLPLRFKKRRRK